MEWKILVAGRYVGWSELVGLKYGNVRILNRKQPLFELMDCYQEINFRWH